MHNKTIPFLSLTPLRSEVKSVIEDVLKKGVFINGEYVDRFKNAFSDYLDVDYVIPTANCTNALEIILRSLGIGRGDEVLTTPFSWISDASVILLVGGKPVFCDIDLMHFQIDFNELEKKITSSTKALILPHLFGLVHPEIGEIVSLCVEKDIVLIEDCAQAQGATSGGKVAGSFGDVAAFSFYPTKNLGALGDAGAIATNNKSLALDCNFWTNHGQITKNEPQRLGTNSRMDELQAAVLFAKLPFLDSDNDKRRQFAKFYFEGLKALDLELPMQREGHVYHQFVIRTNQRNALKEFLIEKGIETDIHYPKALSEMPLFKNQPKYPKAIEATKTVLSLPIHPNHTLTEIAFVVKMIKEFFKA